MSTEDMRLTRLESGYWHARWSSEIWAQWPTGRPVTLEDFFHDSGTASRIAEIEHRMPCWVTPEAALCQG